MAEKPILFMLFADNCNPCKAFQKMWNDAKELQKEMNANFTVVVKHTPTYEYNGEIGDTTIPYYLRRPPHFPCVGIFPANAWKQALTDTTKPYPVNGEILNAGMNADGTYFQLRPPQYTRIDPEILKKWALEKKGVVSNRPLPSIPTTTTTQDYPSFCSRKAQLRPIQH